MSRRVLSQQREMQIYWWLCNNSEIHLWLWKNVEPGSLFTKFLS